MDTDALDDDAPREVSIARLLRVDCGGDVREEAGSIGDRAVLLVRARGTARSELAAELAAASLAHPHLLLPLDHWTESEWLVLAYLLPSTTLADRLTADGLSPGAVVTVLSPVLDVLETLHGAGIAGVDLAPTAIALDDSGAPAVLLRGARVRTGHATRRWRLEDAAVQRDAEAAMSLLHRLAGGSAVPQRVSESIRDRHWPVAAEALLEWAAPLPLSAEFSAPDADSHRALPPVPHPSRRSLRSSARRRPSLSELTGALPRLWSMVAGLRAAGRSVRPRVWALGAAGLVALVAAVVLTSPGGAESAESISSAEGTESAEIVGSSAGPESSGIAESPETEQPERETEAPESSAPEPAQESEQLEALLAELVGERERCLDLVDLDCLEEVVQAGSLLHRDDAAGTPAWRPSGEVDVVVEQRIGDAVIARIEGDAEPASMLAVSTEAGWMIREIWR